MNDEIMVSIDCLTYCHEKYIRKCLDGFLMQQTNFKFEVLVHDDASPDGTADIIREYAEKYPDIVKPILQTENQYSKGVSIGAVYQAPRIKGKYVAFCEGDDFWTDPLKLQKQFDAMEAHPECHLCVHQVMCTDEEGNPTNHYTYRQPETGVLERRTFFRLIQEDAFGTPFQTSSYFLRSTDFRELYINPPEFKSLCMVGDMPMLLYLGFLGNVYCFHDTMSCYRRGVPTSFTTSVPQNCEKLVKLYDQRVKSFESFERYCNYEFRFTNIIQRTLYRKFLLLNDFSSAWKCIKGKPSLCESYKDYFQVYIRAHFPMLYDLQRKLRGKESDE